MTDSEGEKFLDFYGGHCVTLLGHNHPAVVQAIEKQAGKLIFYSNAVYSGIRAEAAFRLVDVSGEGLEKVFFCNSGSEANESALKISRKMTGRQTVIAMENGFHGRTLGSLAATWNPAYRKPYAASLADTVFVPFNDTTAIRLAFQTTPDIAAVILEPIQSMGGVTMIDSDYVQEIRALCDQYGTQLIFDDQKLEQAKSDDLFATAAAYEKVTEGIAFRDAYRDVSEDPEAWSLQAEKPLEEMYRMPGQPGTEDAGYVRALAATVLSRLNGPGESEVLFTDDGRDNRPQGLS